MRTRQKIHNVIVLIGGITTIAVFSSMIYYISMSIPILTTCEVVNITIDPVQFDGHDHWSPTWFVDYNLTNSTLMTNRNVSLYPFPQSYHTREEAEQSIKDDPHKIGSSYKCRYRAVHPDQIEWESDKLATAFGLWIVLMIIVIVATLISSIVFIIWIHGVIKSIKSDSVNASATANAIDVTNGTDYTDGMDGADYADYTDYADDDSHENVELAI